MISFGVFDCFSAPVLMKMRRPSATKALKLSLPTSTIWMFCWVSPAALKTGRV